MRAVNNSVGAAEGGKRSKAPHPSPLPVGEGTDRGELKGYADVKYRVEPTFEKAQKSALSPSGERWAGSAR